MKRPALVLSVQLATRRPCPDRAQLRRWILATLEAERCRKPVQLTVRLVDRAEARALNHDFRGRDYATNVLTFPYDVPGTVSADIVVCVPVVESEARRARRTSREHFGHLVIHGVLHALGHDHEHEAEALRMEALETRILARFRIADPYAD